MERVTLRMPKRQVQELEQLVDEGHYPNRSEAIRSLVRDGQKENDFHTEPAWMERARRDA